VVSRIWKDWRQALIFVKPETVIKWHRHGFRMNWRWKSRSSQVVRPKLDKEIRDLIRRISGENPLWGVPRIQSELRLLGYEIAINRGQIPSAKPEPSLADLEDISGESRRRDRLDRLLHCSHYYFSNPVLFRGIEARSQASRPLQRQRTSHCLLDGATDGSSFSGGYRSTVSVAGSGQDLWS
jgi:hypothetical protein